MSATVENGLSYFEEYQKLLDLREDAKKIIGKVYRASGGGGKHYLVVGFTFGTAGLAPKFTQNSWDIQYQVWDRYPKYNPAPTIHLCGYEAFMRCTEPVDK